MIVVVLLGIGLMSQCRSASKSNTDTKAHPDSSQRIGLVRPVPVSADENEFFYVGVDNPVSGFITGIRTIKLKLRLPAGVQRLKLKTMDDMTVQ